MIRSFYLIDVGLNSLGSLGGGSLRVFVGGASHKPEEDEIDRGWPAP